MYLLHCFILFFYFKIIINILYLAIYFIYKYIVFCGILYPFFCDIIKSQSCPGPESFFCIQRQNNKKKRSVCPWNESTANTWLSSLPFFPSFYLGQKWGWYLDYVESYLVFPLSSAIEVLLTKRLPRRDAFSHFWLLFWTLLCYFLSEVSKSL